MPALSSRDVEVILEGQDASGAYVACPTFLHYRYCWFRDGSFVADAMRQAGERESAERFFDWCARIIRANPAGPWDARYNLDGTPEPSEWPKQQLDGFGLFLWAVRRHGGSRWDDSCALVEGYLREHWSDPCVDWWEEREGVHAATLWCIAEGLDDDAIRDEALRRADERLDASLLFIGEPGLVERVEAELVSPGGGVHRQLEDEYYGGGEWLLLTAMLGQAYARFGRIDEAHAKLQWVRAHATPQGLPEQSQDHLLRPERYRPWVEKWGPPPCPLLWSHAMAIALECAL